MLRVAEEAEQVKLLVFFMAGESFDNGLGRKPLMDKQGQRRHIERQPLGLAGPIQKRLAEGLEPVRNRVDRDLGFVDLGLDLCPFFF